MTPVRSPHSSRPLPRLIRDWSRRAGLSPSQLQLLEAVGDGCEGPSLAARLGVKVSELATLERLFRERTGRTPQDVVADLERIALRRAER